MYNPTKIHSPDIKDAITRITRLTYNQIPSSITQKQGWPPTWTSAGRRRGCSSTDSAQARPSSNQSTQTTTRETSDGAAGKRCVQVVTVTPKNRMTEEGQSSSPEPKKKRWRCCRWSVRSKEGQCSLIWRGQDAAVEPESMMLLVRSRRNWNLVMTMTGQRETERDRGDGGDRSRNERWGSFSWWRRWWLVRGREEMKKISVEGGVE